MEIQEKGIHLHPRKRSGEVARLDICLKKTLNFLQKDLQVKIKYVSLQSQIRGRKFLEEGSAGVYNLRDEKSCFKKYFKIL